MSPVIFLKLGRVTTNEIKDILYIIINYYYEILILEQ